MKNIFKRRKSLPIMAPPKAPPNLNIYVPGSRKTIIPPTSKTVEIVDVKGIFPIENILKRMGFEIKEVKQDD